MPHSASSGSAKSLSISTVLLRNIVALTIFFSVIIATLSVYLFQTQQERSNREQLKTKIDQFANLIDANLRQADFATVAQLGAFAAADPDINLVRITNHLSTVILEKAADDFGEDVEVISREVWSPNVERYGPSQVEFGLRPDQFDAGDFAVLIGVGSLNLLACGLLGYLLFRTINRKVGQPLKQICAAIESHSGPDWQRVETNGPSGGGSAQRRAEPNGKRLG